MDQMVRGNLSGAIEANDAWMRLTRFLAVATTVMLVLYVAWYLHEHSDFSNDDLDNFRVVQSKDFWTLLLTPVDVHYAPVHRLLSWAVYHIAPMNFSVAIAVVMALHVGTIIFLARSLRLLHAGQAGQLVVCAYAASAAIVYGLFWWAHTEHRAPYVFLDACAIYNYLAWMKDGRRARLVYIVLSFLIALGCYEKAVLIPLHLLLIGYLADERAFRTHVRRFLLPLGLMLSIALMYAASYLLFNSSGLNSSFLQAGHADLEFVEIFAATAFGFSSENFHSIPLHGGSPWLWCLVLLLLAMVAWSFRQGHGSWKVLLATFLVLMLDYLPIALSNRGTQAHIQVTRQTRFAYEELQLFALLIGIWCVRVGMAGRRSGRQIMAWLLCFALVWVYAGANIAYVQLGRQQFMGALWVMDYSHQYLRNLRNGLARVGDSAPVFQNDKLPGYLTIFRITPDTRALLPLFLPRVRFDDTANPRYRVQDDGQVVQVR